MCVDKLAASCSSEMQLIIKKHLVRTQSQAYVYLFLQPWPNTICDSNGKPEQTHRYRMILCKKRLGHMNSPPENDRSAQYHINFESVRQPCIFITGHETIKNPKTKIQIVARPLAMISNIKCWP